VRTDGAARRMRTGPGLFTVEDGAAADAADVAISGPPTAVLRWVWNREGVGEPNGVTIEGAPEAVEELRRCIVTAAQRRRSVGRRWCDGGRAVMHQGGLLRAVLVRPDPAHRLNALLSAEGLPYPTRRATAATVVAARTAARRRGRCGSASDT
jgi:hypothetical protein